MEADSRLSRPQWSHSASEFCCSRHAGNLIQTGVKGSQVVPQLILLKSFSQFLLWQFRPQFAFTWRGGQYTCHRLPQGWKHSLTICHVLIQTGTGWSSGTPETHLWCYCVEKYSSRSFWKGEENSPNPSERQFCCKIRKRVLHRRYSFL